LVGDLLLAVYKANSRNAALLDEFLRIRGHEFLKMCEADQRGESSSERAIADIEQVKPGSGMTPSEEDTKADDYSKDTSSHLASSTGVAPTHAKSGPFGMCTKEQPTLAFNSPRKGRFVENIEL